MRGSDKVLYELKCVANDKMEVLSVLSMPKVEKNELCYQEEHHLERNSASARLVEKPDVESSHCSFFKKNEYVFLRNGN